MTVRCQTASIAHQVDPRQGYEGGQLLQELQRREPNARSAIGPRMSEGVEEIAVGVLRQPLQRRGPTSGIADEALQLIAAMGRDLGGGVQRKPVDTYAARTREPLRFALGAKP